jgi:peptide/nickel transport system substrate-binding protein
MGGFDVLKKLAFKTALTVAAAFTLQAQAQEPRRGGTIRFTAPYGASFVSNDSHVSNQIQDEIYGYALHGMLYKWDAKNGKPVLDIAESVQVSADGKTYTYKLRDNALFHNGRKLTSDDVIWSYTRIMDGSKNYPGARYVARIVGATDVQKGQAKEISGLKKIDDSTFSVTLTDKADPGYFLFQAQTAILPAKEAQQPGFFDKPIGLGPFKFVEHVPGSRMAFERWDKYYIAGKPYADKLVISPMGEAAARDVAFRNKEVDVSILGSTQYVAYKADPNLSKGILEVAEVFTRNMGMNPTFKPFSDKRVRQAINHAIDSDLIIKRLVRDKAYRASGWLPLSSPAFDKDAKPYAFDPEKAKKLLVEAGYPDGFEFEWTATPNESWGVPIVEATIPMLAKVGIKVKVKPVETSALGGVVVGGDFQAYIWSNTSGPDTLTALKCFHSSTPRSSCNYTTFKNPAYDKLIDDAANEADAAKQLDLLKKANAMLQDEAPVWFFNYNKAVLAYQPWLHGLQPNATELALQRYEELWVDSTSPAAK